MKRPAWVFVALCAAIALDAHAVTDASFVLTATASNWSTYFPAYLANGYLSTTTAPRGTEGNVAYMVAFMDYAIEDVSRPAAVPGWTEIDYSTGPSSAGTFWLNRASLDDSTFQDYRQIFNLYDATLTTTYRYLDHEKSTAVEVTTLVSEASPHLAATRISMTPDFDGVVQLRFALNLWAPYQPRFPLGRITGEEMQEAVAAHNMKLEAISPSTPDRAPVWYHGDTHVLMNDGNVEELTLSLDGKAEQGLAMAEAVAVGLPKDLTPLHVTVSKSDFRMVLNVTFKVQRGQRYDFAKYVAISREGWGGDAKADLKLAQTARAAGFEDLLNQHKSAWHDLWQSDIIIDGDPTAQRMVHSDLYYLLASSTPDTGWPMGACGLTPGYLGHAFWDSDSWLFPVILLLHPDRAKSLVVFRARTLAAAQARAKARGFKGAMYPWEADPEYGTEETPHFASILGEREIHVNADIAIAQWQYWLATHDMRWLRASGWPVIRNIADFWVSRAAYSSRQHRYEITHVTSVEENYTDIANDTFTNASVRKVFDIASRAAVLVGEMPDPHWRAIRRSLYLPFSQQQQRYLDFDESMPHPIDPWGASVLTLLTYPSLDLPMTRQVRRNDYVYAVKAMEGAHLAPSTMGLPPLSIAAAASGDAQGATKWLSSNLADTVFKSPFNVRSETPENNTGYFITASAGLLQNLIYGLSGLRIEDTGLNAAFAPILPPAWHAVRFTDISFRGQHFSVAIAPDKTGSVKLTRSPL